MNPSAAELAHIAQIVDDRCTGGVIQKVTQPASSRVVLKIRKPREGTTRLLIDLTRNATGFHPTEVPFENPRSAPPFCLSLRALLTGAWIEEVKVVPDDRVVVMSVRRGTDDAAERSQIILEMVPSHPTLLVVDQAGEIVAVSEGAQTAHRTIRCGVPYTPLPSRPLPPSDDETIFDGLDFPFTDEELLAHLDDTLPEQAGEREQLQALKRAIARKLSRHYKRVARVEEDLRRTTGADELRRQGETLKAHLNLVKRGMDTISLPDYSSDDPDNKKLTISLDRTLSAQANVDSLFTRARKKERGIEIARARLDEARLELSDVLALKEASEKNGAEPASLTEEAERLGIKALEKLTPAKKKKPQVSTRVPWLGFRSFDGLEIRVGRTSRDNDVLTFRHAKGNEWWLHAADYPGSHVVVKVSGDLPEQTLLDAATLAVRYSKANFAGKQPVSYTQRKNVTKFRGAAPGKVMLATHRTILVHIEPERLERLEANRM